MRRIVKIILLILISSICYCQDFDNAEKLKGYKNVIVKHCKSYGDWWYSYKLENGLQVEQRNFSGKIQTLVQEIIYDKNKNILFEISSFNINDGFKLDTVSSYKYKYDELNRLVEKRFVFGMVEKFSDFNEFSKPKRIERFNDNGETLYFWPISENLEYDAYGNLIKESKIEIDYPESKNDTVKKYKLETNFYKYDTYGNIVEIRRQYPEQEFPIILSGGFPLYELEKFRYKYNKEKIWTKKYWIVNGKEMLIQRRKFEK
jgi:hypothetical protein